MKSTVTIRELRGMYSALQILANRFLPSLPSDLKVARLVQEIGKYAEPYSTARNKVAPQLMDQAGLTPANMDKLPPLAQQMFVAKLNEGYSIFDDAKVDIEYTDRLILTSNDLPKERAGDKGWENGSAIGAIVADLGQLFEYPKE